MVDGSRHHAMSVRPALILWTIYSGATDHPHGFIARRFEMMSGRPWPTAEIMVEPDLEPLRGRLEALGLVNLGRDPNDEPHIVETWI